MGMCPNSGTHKMLGFLLVSQANLKKWVPAPKAQLVSGYEVQISDLQQALSLQRRACEQQLLEQRRLQEAFQVPENDFERRFSRCRNHFAKETQKDDLVCSPS